MVPAAVTPEAGLLAVIVSGSGSDAVSYDTVNENIPATATPLRSPPVLRVNPDPVKEPAKIVNVLELQFDAVNCCETTWPAV
jgi:hypothetical protein